MTDTASYHDRRRELEASFDGPIPKRRLAEPAPPRRPADAGTVMRRITERRRSLSAEVARSDPTLARLTRHLHWLVMNDRS